jgi:ATP-dependent Clp protease adaptor protein ClpS
LGVICAPKIGIFSIITMSKHTETSQDLERKQGTDVLLMEPKAKAKRPHFFNVVMLNDDYTPMDFVVQVLKEIFRKNHEEALSIMLDVHRKGSGICGIFTRDVAETKAELVTSVAKRHEYPLQCRVEMA